MKNTLYATLLADNPYDAELLDAWLDERTAGVDNVELPDEIASIRQDNRRLANSVGEYDGDIALGQIRILSKRFTADPDVIPYVAVLEEWHEGMWLVVPFSQYSYPATPGEMATGMRHLGLRVMQAWNARTMHDSLLAKSYLFGELSDDVRQDCLSLFRHEMGGRALPEDFRALRGGAITMEADPRRDYIAETIARLQPLSTAVKATERAYSENLILVDFSKAREGKEEGTVLQPLYGTEEFRLAAGGKPMPTTERFRTVGTELTLMYSPEEGTAIFTFWDKNDCPDSSYDGCSVLGTGGVFLGSFRNGSLSVPADAVKGWFQITDKNGNAVKLDRG